MNLLGKVNVVFKDNFRVPHMCHEIGPTAFFNTYFKPNPFFFDPSRFSTTVQKFGGGRINVGVSLHTSKALAFLLRLHSRKFTQKI